MSHPMVDMAKAGLGLVLQKSYLAAKLDNALTYGENGEEFFTAPVPNLPADWDGPATLNAVKLPNGQFNLDLKSLHQLLGGDQVVPFEHFEAQAFEFARQREQG